MPHPSRGKRAIGHTAALKTLVGTTWLPGNPLSSPTRVGHMALGDPPLRTRHLRTQPLRSRKDTEQRVHSATSSNKLYEVTNIHVLALHA